MKIILNNIRRVIRTVRSKHNKDTGPAWLPGETLAENIERTVHEPLRRKGIMLPNESYYEYVERTLIKPLREKGFFDNQGPRDPWKDGNMI